MTGIPSETGPDTGVPAPALPLDAIPHTELHAEVGIATAPHPAPAKPGMPQLDPSSFAAQLFWLGISFVLLYLLMARSVLPRIHEILEKRQHRISQDLDRAETLSGEAEEAKQAYETLHAETKAKAAQAMAEAAGAARTMTEARYAELDRELMERLGEARTQIDKRVKVVRGNLEPALCDIATSLVERLVGHTPQTSDVKAAIEKAQT